MEQLFLKDKLFSRSYHTIHIRDLHDLYFLSFLQKSLHTPNNFSLLFLSTPNTPIHLEQNFKL